MLLCVPGLGIERRSDRVRVLVAGAGENLLPAVRDHTELTENRSTCEAIVDCNFCQRPCCAQLCKFQIMVYMERGVNGETRSTWCACAALLHVL